MLGYHDAVIENIEITMSPGSWDVRLRLVFGGKNVLVNFDSIWWIGLDGLGMVANERQVYSILEVSWNQVPANHRYEPDGYLVYEIQLTSGSRILVVAKTMMETDITKPS